MFALSELWLEPKWPRTHMIHMIYDTFILKIAIASPLLVLKIHVEYSYSSWAGGGLHDTHDAYDTRQPLGKSAIASPLLIHMIL